MRKFQIATSYGLAAALAIGFVAGTLIGPSITIASASASGDTNVPLSFRRPVASDRPAPIKVATLGSDQLTQLQRRVASI